MYYPRQDCHAPEQDTMLEMVRLIHIPVAILHVWAQAAEAEAQLQVRCLPGRVQGRAAAAAAQHRLGRGSAADAHLPAG